ncbi:FAD-binding protein [Leptothoe sp. ISB3NOV94-8A]
MMQDVLVIGSGPAGLAIAAALGTQNLKVHGLAPTGPSIPWSTTFPGQRPLSGVEGDADKSGK